MISSAYIFSSKIFSLQECLLRLDKVGRKFGTKDVVKKGRIFDGVSSVFLNLIMPDETGYDETDFEKIELLLNAPIKTIIQIEYNDGETSSKILLAVIKEIGCNWPIVFDNCYNRIYSSSEIENLIEGDEF